MKNALILLLLLVTVVVGQNVLVSFYSNNPAYPNGWPRAIRETTNGVLVAGWQTNMTVAEYVTYRSNLQASYDSIQSSNQVAIDVALAAKLASLQALFALIQGYQNDFDNGSNYTQAQMAVVIKNHNATLNQLKPFLKDLYLQSLSQ